MSWLGLQSFLTAINDKITRKDDIYIKFAEVVNYHFKYKLFFIQLIMFLNEQFKRFFHCK